MTYGHAAMPHALWDHGSMNEERRKRLRRLGRAYRRSMDTTEAHRAALAAEVVAALADGDPVGEIGREAGFDREWVRRARVAEEQRLAAEQAGS